MDSQSRNLIISGIEPVDELLGGLDTGQLYLVHGEASGKSLFGIKFLIEGLKRGENGALVIRYSPEDAVRRFARLGYDCLEDVYSGRLVILEYSDDIVQKIGTLPEITPVLRELEWLLGETRPRRLIFDPVTSVLAGAEGKLEIRAREFAEWARSFGATVVLIAKDSNHEIIKAFEPLIAESFRFDVREAGGLAARYIAFEKSFNVPDQAIEVDPSRGVFLLGRADAQKSTDVDQAAPHAPSVADLESIREELRSVRERFPKEEAKQVADIDLTDEVPIEVDLTPRAADSPNLASESEGRAILQTQKLTLAEEKQTNARSAAAASELNESRSTGELDSLSEEEPFTPATRTYETKQGQFDELSDLLDDLSGFASPLDLDLPELHSFSQRTDEKGAELSVERTSDPLDVIAAPEAGRSEAQFSSDRGSRDTVPRNHSAEPAKPRPPRHGRASDLRIDSTIAARAVELLLRPPEAGADFPMPLPQPEHPLAFRRAPQPEPLGETEIQAKDFNVLIIEDDAETCELLTETLQDYSLEVVHDGISGLAKLISFKPDLVVLDFDLPIIDGFKVLTLIRSALNVPIIIVSGSRMRAIDRVMASELGADYYLTKPFSAKELKHKARQLIARYRGISSWIVMPSTASRSESSSRGSEQTASIGAELEPFIPYAEFAAEVEKRVRAAMESGAAFSIVGCRLQQMTANGGRQALRLFEIVRGLAREADLTSTNSRNDLVVLLADADTAGARAFAGRLRERVIDELKQEPALWMRSFPELKESTEPTAPGDKPPGGGVFNRRLSDRVPLTRDQAKPATSRTVERSAEKADPRESYIDFLEHL